MVVETMAPSRSARDFEEVSADISFGLLADDAVLATGRALRGEELRDRDRRTLEQAKKLFETLATLRDPDTDFATTLVLFSKTRGDHLLVLEEAVQQSAQGEEPLQPIPVLDAMLGGGVSEETRPAAQKLREVFIHVGKAMLARASAHFY